MPKKIHFNKKEYQEVKAASDAGFKLSSLVAKMEAAYADKSKREFGYVEALYLLKDRSRFAFDSPASAATISKVNNYLESEYITAADVVRAAAIVERAWKGKIYFPTFVFSIKKLLATETAPAADTRRLRFFSNEDTS